MRARRGDGAVCLESDGEATAENDRDGEAPSPAAEKRTLCDQGWARAGLILPAGGVLAEDFSRLLRFRRLVVGRDGSVTLLN